MNALEQKGNAHRSGGRLWRVTGLAFCLCCAPLPALAGQSVVWNGAGAPGTTGELRPDPWGQESLYPDGPSGNSVTMNADVPEAVYGGLDYYNDSTGASVSGNSLIVNSGSAGYNAYGGYAHSGTGTAEARGNSATLNGARVNGDLYGGMARSEGGMNTAAGNSAVVNAGTVTGNVYGGLADNGFGAGLVTAADNSVVINGGTANGGDIYGGYVYTRDGTVAATGNRVTINGGSLSWDVTGGYAFSAKGTAAATGNSITLSGAPLFGPGSDLYGGRTNVGDAFSGNILNVWNYTGSTVKDVQNFQYYDFVLPAAMRDGETLFTATGTAWFDDSESPAGNGARSSITGVNILSGGVPLRTGESVTLMRYGALGNGVYAANGDGMIRGQKGLFLLYDFQLRQTADALSATVARVQSNPRTKALSEGRLAGLAFVNQGADLIAGTGMDAARKSAARLGGQGVAPFIALQGGTSRYDSGSHIDLDGFSLLAGLAWNGQTDKGNLLLGAFVEAGWGNYDTHNAFNAYASVHGDGDTNYRGGGVLGRFDFTPAGPGNPYAEASFRAGRVDTDFSSADLRDLHGRNASYDSGSAYYSAHLGLGYLWNLGERARLDLYTKYFWTHQESDSVSVTDESVRFRSADSRRWRGGAKYSHTLATENGGLLTPYIGLAWEHEFDGEAGATVYGYSLDKPELEGGTGIGELGVSFRPAGKSDFTFDLGVQGYAGVREGVSGSVQAKWVF